MAGWDSLKYLVQFEMIQRGEEGCNVDGFTEKLSQAGDDEEKLMELYEEIAVLPVDPSFPYDEPSELDEIRKQRPSGPRNLHAELTDEQWLDRFYGAWLGRAVGCALGKPLEALCFMEGSDNRAGWENIKLWFEGADAWPIRGYTPGRSRAAEQYGLQLAPYGKKSEREQIRFMESDDDIRYTVLGLMLLEQKGADWDSWDIGKLWHNNLTYGQVCTAETQAYLNFAQVTSFFEQEEPADWAVKNNWVRTHLNPYREWIGAQIRADGFAYGAAGHPELAAEFAWRDASFSHVKNGIYGEMFVAAMIAAAFAESDAEKLVEIGLSEIPAGCRLSSDIHRAVDIARKAKDQIDLVRQIWEAFNRYNPVHTNNNAALVAASLIFAKGDFETAVTTSVLGGWDTDCNGATVGSVMGAMLGAQQLPQSWTSKLNDTLYAEVVGFHPIRISECAQRSYDVFRRIRQTV
ncbi:ADP-ribosylglycohydrolase family protein [Paenibacillus beijingensis]|uniref:Crystallin n=1 Tax=Paenibacillus beijingensis TaxID=1126833 RepID=A0A0D5NEI3_9BACL|nr:ADP-ribosylglycohydrolase family protein [Paenibacillus beijingensis]AJY73789.1 crystallin [Paenibacillus beijingensis]